MPESTIVVPLAGEVARGWGWTLVNALIAAALALAFFTIYYLPAVLGRPLLEARELRTAAVARQMLENKDYLRTAVAKEGEVQVNMPPVPFWQVAAVSAAFFGGASADTAAMARATQLPPALCTALSVCLIVFFGCIFFGRIPGIIAGLILGTAMLTAQFAQTGSGEPALMLACTGALCGMALLLSGKPGLAGALLAGLSLGLGILTKGHVPLILMAIPLGIEMVLRRKHIGWFHIAYAALAFLIAILIALPWFILVERQQPGAIGAMVVEAQDAVHKMPPAEIAASESTAPATRLKSTFFYYFYKGPLSLFPWTVMLAVGFIVTLLPLKGEPRTVTSDPGAGEERSSPLRFFGLFAGIGFVLLLIAQRKQDYYLLPLFPAVALAAGAVLGRLNMPGGIREERMAWWQLAAGVVGAAAILCAPLWPHVLNVLYAAGVSMEGAVRPHVVEFSTSVGWFAIPIALAFFAVNFLCARFWTGGKCLAAVTLYAALMAAAIVFSAVRSSPVAPRATVFFRDPYRACSSISLRA